LDTGHGLLAGEKPQEIVRAAGIRLGYVQMNDNDGKKDRHWALLDGRLREDDLLQTIAALKDMGYDGTLGLELSGKLPSLASSLAKNRNLLMRLQAPVEVKSLQEPEARRKH
jgi:sugar phosphate isomerase/epimerase